MTERLLSNASPLATAVDDVSVLGVSRAYQFEMFEFSLKGNTIVVMDTGSGKTHVAILRIMHELENSQHSKFIWFLAPTVTLCIQQHEVLRRNIPSVSIRLIIGSDNVQRWTTQAVWDDLLGSHRIIVSTHAILSDALDHGFVNMQQIGLLIFDEAHHCSLDHPANRIMKNHYHPQLRRFGKEAAPAILGLTASPVMKAKVRSASLRLIESNLNAIAKTPRVHREELRSFVHLPALIKLRYLPDVLSDDAEICQLLRDRLESIDIMQDPCVVRLISNSASEVTIAKVIHSRKTHSQDELCRFLRRIGHVRMQLGVWASYHYFHLALTALQDSVASRKDTLFGWDDEEKQYLCNILDHIQLEASITHTPDCVATKVSLKFQKLAQFLCSLQQAEFSGIIFVDQRTTATMLCKLLSAHPATSHLKCATFVGNSDHANRRAGIGDLADLTLQNKILGDFRVGSCDIIVATSVLEEGIDISSCNLVVCFDKPPSLKSFIQRRGRARDSKSVFVIMISEEDVQSKKVDWDSLEQEMIRTYQDERRKVETVLQREEFFEKGDRRFEIQATGAILTLENALPLLNHFCNLLPRSEHADNRPVFSFHETDDTHLVYAEVILPNSVDPSVRRKSGSRQWRTERKARKDAAFEAFIGLYQAGLVNDHLVPSPVLLLQLKPPWVKVPSFEKVTARLNPWIQLAKDWSNSSAREMQTCAITIERPSQNDIQMLFLLPSLPPSIPNLKLFWNPDTVYNVCFNNISSQDQSIDNRTLEMAQIVNSLIFRSANSPKMHRDKDDILTIFAPALDCGQMANWMMENSGNLEANEIRRMFVKPPPLYQLVRNSTKRDAIFLFRNWRDDEDAVEATSLPRRRNFFQRGRRFGNTDRAAKAYHFPRETTTFEMLSTDTVEFSLLIPCIMNHIERIGVASHLSGTLLKPVGFQSISLVMEAITASSVEASSNYQRLELIGDSTLKFIVANQLFARQSRWHEGYLSQAKDSIVANSRLTRAAIDKNLAQWISTAHFSPRKWRPMYISDLLKDQPQTWRQMSTKLMADVVEALIGAALLDGGLPSAVICASIFLEEIEANDIHQTLQSYRHNTQSALNVIPSGHLGPIQKLLSYEFENAYHLLSSLTHTTLTADITTPSYQRLEFLGDAVLDMLIVRQLAAYTETPLTHVQMHLIKSALVNAEFLAFLCMEFAVEEEVFDVEEVKDNRRPKIVNVQTICKTRRVALCDFMRYQSADVTRAREACLERYKRLAPAIRGAIDSGDQYPWALLVQLNSPKFLSDILEAVLGAVFVDSGGDLEACEVLIERLRILEYLRRIVREKLDILHPKTRLGELVARQVKNEKLHEAELRTKDDETSGRPRDKIRYTIAKEDEEGRVGYRCYASFGELEFAEVREGLSREEITTRAADVAVRALSR